MPGEGGGSGRSAWRRNSVEPRTATSSQAGSSSRTDDRRRVDVTVQDSAKALGWAFFGPLIDAAAAVLDRRSAAERAVIDAFLDDMVAAVGAVDASGRG